MAAPVAIITGAGSGIGRAVAQRLAADGWRLTLVGRDESKLLETVERLADQPVQSPETLVLPADISDRPQAESVIDVTAEKWGRVDALINNAAALHVGAIDQVDEDALFATFAANVFGPAYLIGRCWRHFVKQRDGRIVNVSSMSSIDPFPGLSIYAASKSALESLTRSAMSEGARHGIRAFSVVLGAVETAMLRRLVSTDQLPTERTLEPLHVAEIIAACAKGDRDAEAGRPIIVPSP